MHKKILRKLNQVGFSLHYILPVAVIAVVALAGARIIFNSHAATPSSEGISLPAATDKPPGLVPSNSSLKKKITLGDEGECLSYSDCWYYVGGDLNSINATGASVSITQADPTVNSKDNHSNAEIAVQGIDGNFVEIGWIVSPAIYGDSLSHLFVSNWVNGTFNSCWNGCKGFVSQSTEYSPGSVLKAGTVGSFGAQYINNNWQFNYNGQSIGYFPESIWNGSFTTVSQVQIYGEVESSSMYFPQTQMGNGKQGSSTAAAAFTNLALIGSTSPEPKLITYTSGGTPKYSIGNITNTGFSFGGLGYTSSNAAYLSLYPLPVSGMTVDIQGSTVPTPGDTFVSQIVWNWGDGSSETDYPAFPTAHTYKSAGTYTIVAKATEAVGKGSKPKITTSDAEVTIP